MGYSIGVPQVARVGKFTITVNTNDHEPAHVHVRFDDCEVIALIGTTVVLRDVVGKVKTPDIVRALEAVGSVVDQCNAKWKEIHVEKKPKPRRNPHRK